MFRCVSARIYELYIICERTACWGKHAYATTRHSSGPSLPARRRRASGCPLYARAGKHPRLFGWSGAGSWIRTELLTSRYERKHMVPTWRHSLLALHRLSSRRRMAKHWSSRGSGLVADAAAAVPYSMIGLPVAAGEQDLSSFGLTESSSSAPPRRRRCTVLAAYFAASGERDIASTPQAYHYIQRDVLYVVVHLRLDGSAPAAAGSRIT